MTNHSATNCGTCRFARVEGDGWHTCRRHAPRATFDQNCAFWPIVSPDDWCGEWDRGNVAKPKDGGTDAP